MKKDKLIRKLIPSVPILARIPLFPFFLDLLDYFVKKKHPEWKELPPASLRMRIGVGNYILNNHEYFIKSGKSIVEELKAQGYINNKSKVLELGCGCGRNALFFKKFLDLGSYVGQDVDNDMIKWCQNNLSDERTKFFHANVQSNVYNPKGKPVSEYFFPSDNNSINGIVSVSVFSHLVYNDFLHYVRESRRVLTPGGFLHMTLFIMDYIKDSLGDRWNFSHKLDNCYIENARYPEAAVAYDFNIIKEMFEENNLIVQEIYNTDDFQQTLILKKN